MGNAETVMLLGSILYFYSFALNEHVSLGVFRTHLHFLHYGTVFGVLISPGKKILKSSFLLILRELQHFPATEASLLLCMLKTEMLRFARVIYFFFNVPPFKEC